MRRVILPLLLASIAIISCKNETKKVVTPLKSETDSLAYVIGMSIADNLFQMDSTLNVDAVCRAITEEFKGRALISKEDAKSYYLRHLTYVEPELKRNYEDQYLEDLSKRDRDFTRTKSGLTYSIDVIGDESLTPRNNNDLVSICYTINRIDNSTIYSSYDEGDTLKIALKDLNKGLSESVKMIGKGGKLRAWIPSKLAYSEVGDSELEIQPFETLLYSIELIDLDKNGARDENRTNW